jgi:hypothetical protein
MTIPRLADVWSTRSSAYRSPGIALLGFLLFPAAGSVAATEPLPYAVTRRPLGDRHSILVVTHRQTGRLIWTRTIDAYWHRSWSSNGRALVVADGAPPVRLLVWRVGEKVRVIRNIAPLSPNQPGYQEAGYPPLPFFDSIADMIWSPDNDRILLRGYQSMGIPLGHLWCLHVKSGKAHLVEGGGVAWAEWLDARRVRYCYVDQVPAPTPEGTRWRERIREHVCPT